MDLIGAIHRRAGIDHIAQRRMIVAVHRLMPRQHGQDGRHGEHVADAMPLDELPGLLAVQPFAGQQHGDGAACHLAQRMNAGAMRQRRHHQRGVLLRRARHQIAQMVADHVFHLPMRQHAGLRSSRGPRGVEEPRRIIAIDIGRAFDQLNRWSPASPTTARCHQSKYAAAHSRFPRVPRPHAPGNATSKICTAAPEDCARYATSGGVSRKFVGTHTAPSIHDANIVSSTAFELRACSSTDRHASRHAPRARRPRAAPGRQTPPRSTRARAR